MEVHNKVMLVPSYLETLMEKHPPNDNEENIMEVIPDPDYGENIYAGKCMACGAVFTFKWNSSQTDKYSAVRECPCCHNSTKSYGFEIISINAFKFTRWWRSVKERAKSKKIHKLEGGSG